MDMLQKGQEIYSIEETPSWVKKYAIPKIDNGTDSPFSFPLVDYQDCINDGEICSYRGTYQCVNDESRIEDASLLGFEIKGYLAANVVGFVGGKYSSVRRKLSWW